MKVRQLREDNIRIDIGLKPIWESVKNDFPNEWLFILEMYEIAKDESLKSELLASLKCISTKNKEIYVLIKEGLALIDKMENSH